MGKSISPETLNAVQSMIDETGGGSLRDVLSHPQRSNAFLQRMLADGVLTSAERPQFVDTSTGGMTEEGKRVFEKALLGKAIDDPAVMDAAPKHVMAKLTGSIGDLAGLGARSDEWNVLPEVRRAIKEHAAMAASGIGVDDYLNQQSLFGDYPSPAAQQMMRVLAQNPNAVRQAFRTFGQDSRYAAPGQFSFGGPTAHDAFNHAFGGKLTPEGFAQR
jgi:hypothetical protein